MLAHGMGRAVALAVVATLACDAGSTSTSTSSTPTSTATPTPTATSTSTSTPGTDSGPPNGGVAFGLVQNGSSWVATSTVDAALQVEVDCDDDQGDGRYFGIVPVLAGKKLEISMYGGGRFPLIVPNFDAGAIRCVRVESDRDRLLVRFEAGTYKTLNATLSEDPVPLEAAFTVEAGRLVGRLSGIYYVMPTAKSTTLRIVNGTTTTRTIAEPVAAGTEYFDDVTAIDVEDAIYGAIQIETSILRLQLQLFDDGSRGFELDLDHSVKERGQLSVTSRVSFR